MFSPLLVSLFYVFCLRRFLRIIIANIVAKLHPDNPDDVILPDDETWMRQALQQAQQALLLGEVPVGAVAVWRGEIIGAGFNRKEATNDPTSHAEITALQQAAAFSRNWRLIDVTLYCTLEPCAMCAGAMIQARLSRLVYGGKDTKFGADGSVVQVIREDRFNHRVAVTAGVLEDESVALLQEFFTILRDVR